MEAGDLTRLKLTLRAFARFHIDWTELLIIINSLAIMRYYIPSTILKFMLRSQE